jgi:serine protease
MDAPMMKRQFAFPLLALALGGCSGGAIYSARNHSPDELAPREAALKTTAENPLEIDASDRALVVKFHEGSLVRVREGRFAHDPALDNPYETARRARLGLSLAGIADTVAAANALLEGSTLRRMFNQDEESLAAERVEAEESTGEEYADLDLYARVETDSGKAAELARQLNALPGIEIAYPAPVPSMPAVAAAPRTVVNVTQGYLDEQHGIAARFAWQFAGGRGKGTSFIDVEGGWDLDHEDLKPPFHSGGMNLLFDGAKNHGSAVLGVVAAQDNGFGAVGITPDARIGVHSTASLVGWWIAAAINDSAKDLGRGDVIIIEQHFGLKAFGFLVAGAPNEALSACDRNESQRGFLPVEQWPLERDAIRAAVAKGIIVVEAAGNGTVNLDHASLGDTYSRRRDTGAIFVGAGTSESHKPLCWSNHGARLDLQGWGEAVGTLGYGELRSSGDNRNGFYTQAFGGTSSASPIVAGAALAINGIRGARGMTKLDSREMRKLLRDTGTPQKPDDQQIGPLPNLRDAILSFTTAGGAAPGTLIKDAASGAVFAIYGHARFRVVPEASAGVHTLKPEQVAAVPEVSSDRFRIKVPLTPYCLAPRSGNPVQFELASCNEARTRWFHQDRAPVNGALDAAQSTNSCLVQGNVLGIPVHAMGPCTGSEKARLQITPRHLAFGNHDVLKLGPNACFEVMGFANPATAVAVKPCVSGKHSQQWAVEYFLP